MAEYLVKGESLTAIADAIRVQSEKADLLTLDQMPGEILDLNSLNFTVVGGTTEPVSPKENTIWVSTDTEITGWVFSAVQPETVEEGLVWIAIGTISTVEFNSLKKNGIHVYPLSARQYVNGALVKKTAKSYRGGKWVEWFTYLIENGVDRIDITGGWTAKCTSFNGYTENLVPVCLTGDGFIDFSGGGGYLYTEKIFDLTDINTLVADANWSGANTNYSLLGIVPTGGISDLNQMIAKATHPNFNAGRGEIRLDISALSGYYRICVGC